MRFRVSDIFLPAQEQLNLNLAADEEIEGVITQFSDSGQRLHMFASVDVQICRTLVVEVHKLQVITKLTEKPVS